MPSRLSFTPGNHAYFLLGDNGKKQRLPSVTTLLNQLAKPALVKWAARAAADYATDNWSELASMPPSERAKRIAAAPDQARNTAAAKGTQIHTWAEQLIAGQPVSIPEEYTPQVEGFARWWEKSHLQTVHAEMLVWSDDDDLAGCAYAGKADLLAADDSGTLWLIDHKTGSGIWPEMALQLAGYATAENWVVDGNDMPAGGIQRWGVTHIRPDGTTLHLLENGQRRAAAERWEILRALRTVDEPQFREVVV